MVITIGNLLPLDAELKEQFQKLFRTVKRNTIALAKRDDETAPAAMQW